MICGGGCGKQLRGRDETRADKPGTVMMYGLGMCRGCYDDIKYGPHVPPEARDPLEYQPVPLWEGWREQAKCAMQGDPDLFYATTMTAIRDARMVCSGCPVRRECLTDAVESNLRDGVWGGLTESERRRIDRLGLARRKVGA